MRNPCNQFFSKWHAIILFATLYIFLHCWTWYTHYLPLNATTIASFALFSAFVTGITVFLTNLRSLSYDKKLDMMIAGATSLPAMHDYINFIAVIIFNYLVAKSNGTLTMITVNLLYIPAYFVMPSLFFIAASVYRLFKSIPLTIIMLSPIAHGIAVSLQMNSASVAATILCGTLYGQNITAYDENLSYKNIWSWLQKTWILQCAAFTHLLITSTYSYTALQPNMRNLLQISLKFHAYITILPYCAALIASYYYRTILMPLIAGSCLAMIIQIFYHQSHFLSVVSTMFAGCYTQPLVGMMLLLSSITTGIAHVIKQNSTEESDDSINAKKNTLYTNHYYIQSIIFLRTCMINAMVLIEAISLRILNRSIQDFSNHDNLPTKTTRVLLSTTTAYCQTLLPYSIAMIFAMQIHQSFYLHIMSNMIYPCAIFSIMLIAQLTDYCSKAANPRFKI